MILIPLGALYITGTWFAAQMFSNDIIILIICRISCHLDFYKNWRSRDFKWRKSEITVLVFIDTLKRVQSCQRKVRATLTDRGSILTRASQVLPLRILDLGPLRGSRNPLRCPFQGVKVFTLAEFSFSVLF